MSDLWLYLFLVSCPFLIDHFHSREDRSLTGKAEVGRKERGMSQDISLASRHHVSCFTYQQFCFLPLLVLRGIWEPGGCTLDGWIRHLIGNKVQETAGAFGMVTLSAEWWGSKILQWQKVLYQLKRSIDIVSKCSLFCIVDLRMAVEFQSLVFPAGGGIRGWHIFWEVYAHEINLYSKNRCRRGETMILNFFVVLE